MKQIDEAGNLLTEHSVAGIERIIRATLPYAPTPAPKRSRWQRLRSRLYWMKVDALTWLHDHTFGHRYCDQW